MKKRGALSILDSRGNPIYASGIYDGSSASKIIPRTIYNNTFFSQDYHVNVSSGDWLTLLSRSRELYANMSPIASTIRELARLTVGDAWRFKFTGKDAEWGILAKDFFGAYNMYGNFLGGLWTLQQSMRNIVISVIRDGDVLVVLTESAMGFPQFQLIPAHRIQGDKIESGRYKNLKCVSGVILDKQGRPVAYNIKSGGDEPDTQISTRDSMLVYDPNWVDGRRGLPHISSAVPSWNEYKEILESELRSIKALSNYALQMVLPEEQIQDMETGEYSDSPFAQKLTTDTTAGEKVMYVEKSQLGGEILMFRPTDGAKIEPIAFDRPGGNTTQFLLQLILRNCFSSLDVPSEFAFQLDSGGATVRNLAVKIQRRVEDIQNHIIRPIWVRLARYAIAKAIKNGMLPASDEWDKFEPTYPREYTIDNGRDVKADIELYKIGVYTGEILAEQYGYDYKDNVDKKIEEGAYVIEKSRAAGVDPVFVIQSTPNANNTIETQPTSENTK